MDPLALLRLLTAKHVSPGSASAGTLPIGELRFVIEFDSPADESVVSAQLIALLGEQGFIVQRFGDGMLPNFLLLRFPGVEATIPQRDAFAIGYALAEALAARTVEPDLPTSFFDEPRPPSATATIEAARAIGALCWVNSAPPADLRWALASARVPAAWSRSRGKDILVAQPDSGVTRHTELEGMLRLDLARDVLDNDADPTDPLDPKAANPGHGTGTASVVASRDSGRLAGAAPEAELIPIRCLTDVKVINAAPVTAAILHAIKAKAHVVSMSLGGVPSRAMHKAIEHAIAADMIVVAAAGNCVRMVVWPAHYDEVIAVAGTNIADTPWKGSSRGNAVDIAAPAELVWRAQRASASDPIDAVEPGQGTSFATALVAGIAALWFSHHGRSQVIGAARARGVSVQALFRSAVKATARTPDNWDSDDFGPGIIDAGALLDCPLDAIPAAGAEARGTADRVGLLLTEEIGPGVRDASFASERFEAEIATIALAQSSLGAAPEALTESTKWPGTRPSPQLDAAVKASSDDRLHRFGTSTAMAIVRPSMPAPAILPPGGTIPADDQRKLDQVALLLRDKPGDLESDEKLMKAVDQALAADRIGVTVARAQRVVAEALVKLTGRPALRVRGGRIELAAAGEWHHRLYLLAASDTMETNLAKVGRIDAGGSHVGTGFLVGSGLILTNRHVLQMIAAPVPRRRSPERWVLTEEATIDFADEPSSETPASRFVITDIAAAGPDPIEFDGIDLRHLDAAFLVVESVNGSGTGLPKPLSLDPKLTAADAGRAILVGGYPAPPPSLPLNASGAFDDALVRRLAELYRADYGTKYVAPGEIAAAPGHHPLDGRRWIFTHDATTLVGNSGSAVLSMTGDQAAVGLHFGGQWMRENYAHSLAALNHEASLPGFADLNWVRR